MKIVEAMKKVKENKEKIADLQKKISQYCANMSYETLLYGVETPAKIKEWAQSCHDLALDNVNLLVRISKTNLQTHATIVIGEQPITKCVAEWIWRRREYAAIDLQTWANMTDRGLKEALAPPTSQGAEPTKITIVRHFDPVLRDKKIAAFKSEPHAIDSYLEVINATTELLD